MRNAAFCLQLAAVGQLLVESQPAEFLEAPSNVFPTFEDAVVLHWSWTGPELAKLEDVEFVVSVESESGFLEYYTVESPKRPFFFHLYSLEPTTKYTVGVWARHPLWKDSPVTKKTFTTTVDDLPIPYLRNVTATRSQKFMNYSVSWKLDHQRKELLHVEVIVCHASCHVEKALPPESKVFFSINFYTKFHLRVAALYKVYGVDTTRRESRLFIGRSDVGPPEKIQNITQFYQWGNKLRIDWLPSNPPNGPIDYHEVFVQDPRNPFRNSRVNVTSGTSATLLAPHIHGDLYKIGIRAVNIDSKGVEHKSVTSIFGQERIHSTRNMTVELLQRGSRRVHFKILPDHPQENMIYNVHTSLGKPAELRKLNGDEFEVTGLEPLKTFLISVHACYPTTDVRTHTCEDVRYFNLSTNVEAPSPVMNLRLHETEDRNFILTWAAPQSPNGRLDKYKITVMEDDDATPFYIFVPSPQYWMRFNRTDALKSPQFGVAAVNIDLDDEKLEHMGPMTFVRGSRYRPRDIILGFLTLMLLFCLLFKFVKCIRESFWLKPDASDHRDDDQEGGNPEGDQELYEF